MIVTKLISLDTSVFGAIAADYFSRDNLVARKVVQFLIDNGFIPLFSIHHIAEHLQCSDIKVIDKRFSLIRSFPVVAWIKGGVSGLPGSIIDLMGSEISLMQDGVKDPSEILQKSKQYLIRYGSGEDLICRHEEILWTTRALGCFKLQRSKAIDSLVHVANRGVLSERLYDIKKYKRNTSIEALKKFDELKRVITDNLVKSGDKKLEKVPEVTDWFIGQVKADAQDLFTNDNLSLFDHLLNSYGLSEKDIDKNTTVGDLGEIATHKEQLKIVARSYDLNLRKSYKFPMKSIPSKYITSEVEKCIRSEKRASGSNVIDKYISALSLYVDLNIVDKRVNEYISQIKRKKHPISKLITTVAKVSHYSEVEKVCKEIL